MRSLTINQSIREKLTAAMSGDDLPDLNSIRVYEATAVTTRPVSKVGTLWDKGVITRATLREMEEYLNTSGYVPMHVSHNQGGGALPVGRAFYAELFDLEDGETELRVLFYLPEEEDDLVKSVESGVLKNLSIGMRPSKLLCSECGWDYLGEDASYLNLFDRICANDHQVGVDGVHVRAAGLDKWLELSLVSVGASSDAEIKSRAKSRLSEDDLQALAASGIPAEAVVLVATTEGETPMDLKEVLAELKANAGSLAVAEANLSAKTAELETATAALSEANAKIAELEAAAEKGADEKVATLTAEVDTLKADLTASKEEADKASEFLKEQTVKVLVAAGHEDPKAPETIEECISAIEEAKLSIVNTIPVGGVTASADTPSEEVEAKRANFDAFKS